MVPTFAHVEFLTAIYSVPNRNRNSIPFVVGIGGK